MSIKKLPRVMAALAAAMALQSAEAVIVQHSLAFAGGNSWLARFSITNDGGMPELAALSIYVSWAEVHQLSVLTSPAGWDSLVLQPDAALLSDGMFDTLALGSGNGVLPGQTVSGFRIQFDWSGSLSPQDLRFTVNDPVTFSVLDSGVTVGASPTMVPEPATWLLFTGALVAIWPFRRVLGQRRAQ